MRASPAKRKQAAVMGFIETASIEIVLRMDISNCQPISTITPINAVNIPAVYDNIVCENFGNKLFSFIF